MLGTAPDTAAMELDHRDPGLRLSNHQTDNTGIQTPQSLILGTRPVFDFGILEI